MPRVNGRLVERDGGAIRSGEVGRVNPRQKSVLLAGIFLVALAAVYPPWVFVDKFIVRGGTEDSERFAGYQFFFTPPAAESPTLEYKNLVIATSTRIETHRLTVEWAAIVLVVTGMLFLLRSQGDSPRNPGKSVVGIGEAAEKPAGSLRHPNANAVPIAPRDAKNPRKTPSVTFNLKRPHWAVDDLLNQDLDANVEVLRGEGLVFAHFITDHDPVLFLNWRHPEAPPWLAGAEGLSPLERLNLFDKLLRHYYPTGDDWPPTDDVDTRRLEVLRCVYLMYHDTVIGMPPPPLSSPRKS